MRVIALMELIVLTIANLVWIVAHTGLNKILLTTIPSRPSDEGSTLLNTLAPSSLGTISESLPSPCTSSPVFSLSSASIHVSSAPSLRYLSDS